MRRFLGCFALVAVVALLIATGDGPSIGFGMRLDVPRMLAD